MISFHFYGHDMTRQVEAHHFCGHQNEEMRQCLIYDGPEADARLIGLEYIVSENLFMTLPDAVEATLGMSREISEIAPRYRYMERCIVIGRGFNYATAFETALKLKELTYTIVEPYSSADFLHGPLAMIERGFPAIVIAPSGLMSAEMAGFAQTLRDRQAEVIAISDDPRILKQARIPLALPAPVPEWLSPVTAIVPGQFMSMCLAHVRDYDVDSPRAIRKVTETV